MSAVAGDMSLAAAAADVDAGMVWWNLLAEAERAQWLRSAGSAVPAEAWAFYKNVQAVVRHPAGALS